MSIPCAGIPPNSEISGIGIRTNFYATIIITSVIPRRPSTEKLLDALNANAAVMGFALLITAIIQTFQNRLDLYHALFVLNMVYVLGLIVYCSGVFKWTITHFRLGATFQIMTVSTFLVWSGYIWSNAHTFGSTPECNAQVKYIVLFVSVRATVSWLWKLWIVALCLSGYFVVVGIVCARLVIRWAHREGIDKGDLTLEKYSPKISRILSAILVEVAVLSIVTTEMLVARNKDLILPGETDWAFGQVLALVMIVMSLREVLKFIRYYPGRHSYDSPNHTPNDPERELY